MKVHGETTMSKECKMCGKKPESGNNVSHSHVKTKRKWYPNLQQIRVNQDGLVKRLRVCTGCLKTIAKKALFA